MCSNTGENDCYYQDGRLNIYTVTIYAFPSLSPSTRLSHTIYIARSLCLILSVSISLSHSLFLPPSLYLYLTNIRHVKLNHRGSTVPLQTNSNCDVLI